MEMLNLTLPATNRFATEYLAGTSEIQRFFHYNYTNPSNFKARLLELQNRSFMRKELAQCIEKYMSPFPTSDKVKHSLAKLTKDNSVVVIGGQQAGILTGPLYSIHKIISIITLARKLEGEWNIPVVPVFWIAGEDHDFLEVNHIYVEHEEKVKKVVYPEKIVDKKMVSNIHLNKKETMEWVEEIIGMFGETEHTKSLLQLLKEGINESKTFVDFFSYLIMEIFKEDGLLIIDSGDEGLRRLEKEIFIKQIEHVTQITETVRRMQQQLAENGFKHSIEISDRAANLFYCNEDKERILLEYDPDSKQFSGKNEEVSFAKQDLLQIASEFPFHISNNVVTRPITQDMLFPTIAFIAGPGEIAYWAELKEVFELFSIKMPPIMPRLNITLLSRSIETDLEELGLSLHEVLTSGTEMQCNAYISSVKDQELEKLFKITKEQLLENYRSIGCKLNKGLIPLFEKNQRNLIKQIEFMEDKTVDTLREKHQVVLNKYRRVENYLHPLGSPQERILNALYYMNSYGINFFTELTKLNYEFDGKHSVIKI